MALALLEPGTSAVYAQHSFAVYRLAAGAPRGAGQDYGHDLDAMFDAIADDTRVVFIASPNNPTGTFVPGEQVAAFLERVQAAHGDRVTVVLDEAHQIPGSGIPLRQHRAGGPRCLSSRTSKAYGLAGLRAWASPCRSRR